MPTSLPSSSSISSTNSPNYKANKRKWSRELLLKHLQVIGTLPPPMPLDLPPSPPASRSSSPAPSTKRKFTPTSDVDHSKRPRISSLSDRSGNTHHAYSRLPSLPPPPPPPSLHFRPPPSAVYALRTEPSEDGEVTEEAAVASSRSSVAVVTSSVPIRRPRHGRPPSTRFDQLHDKYHQFGRLLKYSGDARFWSTFPSTHKEYRPLPIPPPLNSPYHKHGGLVARLELIDALVCFTYAIWCRDYGHRQCQRETWGTIDSFLHWCRHKWQSENTVGDREKAFIGLIFMIEAFINARMFTYATTKHVDAEVQKLVRGLAAAEENQSSGTSSTLGSQATPPMLPSPASLPATSANSTPVSQSNGTPKTNTKDPSAPGSAALVALVAEAIQPPLLQVPPPNHRNVSAATAPATATGVTVPIAPSLIHTLKDQCTRITKAKHSMDLSQKTLTLPIMAQHFPSTFARMVHSSLLAHEEHEPDIEDEEGELFWPGGCGVTGEGLGWVCLMGKAMIAEFGKEIGYRGLDGVVPKPKPEQGPETPSEGPSPGQAVSSAPSERK